MKSRHWIVSVFLALCLVLFIANEGFSKGLVLRWAHPSPKRPSEVKWLGWFTKEVERQTQGRVKFQIYWGGSLCKITEMAGAVKSGLADVGWIAVSYHTGYGELAGVARTAYFITPITSPIELTKRWLKLWKMTDAFYKEFEKTNMIPIVQRYYDVFWAFTKKPVRRLEDYKGMKIRAVTEGQQVAYKAIGAVPMFLPASEIYSALQKGILDAVGFSPDTANRYKIQEVTKYVIRQDVAPGWAQWCMNLNTWKKISPKDQKVILKLGDEASIMIAKLMEEERVRIVDVFKKAGLTIMDLPKEEQQRWNNLPEVKAYGERWVKEREAKGLPARKVAEMWKALLEQ